MARWSKQQWARPGMALALGVAVVTACGGGEGRSKSGSTGVARSGPPSGLGTSGSSGTAGSSGSTAHGSSASSTGRAHGPAGSTAAASTTSTGGETSTGGGAVATSTGGELSTSGGVTGGSVATSGSTEASSTTGTGTTATTGGTTDTGSVTSTASATTTGGASTNTSATSTGGVTTNTGATTTGGATTTAGATTSSGSTTGSTGPAPMHVFVIALENQAASDIYGSSRAPYLNTVLAPIAARATHWSDVLPLAIESGPHYVWMEAGTNAFPDHTFLTDDDPSAANSTASTDHLVTQLQHAGKSWRVYMQGLDANSGACPLNSNGNFAAWHNPVVWFRDVSGDPPSTDNAFCAQHHREYGSFAADLGAGDVADFTFITPDLCHDMHGLPSCPDSDAVLAGDTWLSTAVPPILDFVNRNGGVLYLIWDETSATNSYGDPLQPFFAVGPTVKKGAASSAALDHSAYLRTVEEQLGLPILPSVQGAPDLGDLFSGPVAGRR